MRLGNCPPNYQVFICEHVFANTRPIKLVVYDNDGELCLLCGLDDHDWEANRPRVVGLGHLIDRHEGIKDIDFLPNFEAQLMEDNQWVILPMSMGSEGQ